jgi:WD40 repeat protein
MNDGSTGLPPADALPYPGLRPFRTDEAEIFFGREEHTDQLLAKLQTTRFLAVIGVSGCGKSSLVRAGLIPALRTGLIGSAGGRWRIAELRPGDRPRARLAAAFAAERIFSGERYEDPASIALIEATLRKGPLGLTELLRELPPPPNTNILIFVDQFEEIFRYRASTSADEAEAFVALLLASAANREFPVYIVIAMRSDFLGDCALFSGLPEAINESQYLTPRLTREQIRETIVRPARMFGGDVEPALVNRLLNEIGPDPDQLPVLQHALMRMWETARARGTAADASVVLNETDYRAVGSLGDALNDHAEQVLRSIGQPPEPGADIPDTGAYRIARILFQRLTERGSGRRDTRRPTRMAEIAEVAGCDQVGIAAVVQRFRAPDNSFLAPASMVTGDTAGSADEFIDIGHESLIRKWKRLSGWVAAEAASAAIYRRLLETAFLWRSGRSALWVDPDLAEALKWRTEHEPTEPWARRYAQGKSTEDFALAMQFLDESSAEAARRKDLEVQQARERSAQEARERDLTRTARTAWIFRLLAAGLAVAVVGAMFALRIAQSENASARRERQNAEEFGRIARARELAAVGAARLDVEPNVAAAFALRSLGTSVTLQGDVLLRQSLFRMADAVFRGHDGRVVRIVYGPDGRHMAAAYDDGTIEVRDLANGSATRALRTEARGVRATTFTGNEQQLAIAIQYDADEKSNRRRGEVLLADAAGQGSPTVLRAPDRGGAACDISRIAGSGTGRPRLLDEPYPLALAFDRMRNTVVSGWSDGRIVLWDLAKPSAPLVLDPEPKDCTPMRSVHIAQDGTKIYGARADRVVFVWNAASLTARPQRFMIAGAADDALQAFTLDRQGTRGAALVVRSSPGRERGKESSLRVIRLKRDSGNAPPEVATLWQTGSAFSANILFSGDGTQIIAADADGTIRIFDADTGVLRRTLRGHAGEVDTLALLPSGQAFSSGGVDGTVRNWSLTPLPVRPLVGHHEQSTSVAFSPDGTWLASGGMDGTVRIWDVATATQRAMLGKHGNSVYAVAISPDGTLVASASGSVIGGGWGGSDRSIRIWNVGGGDIAHRIDPPADVLAAAFSPDGRLLGTVGAEPALRLWDVASGHQAAEVPFGESGTRNASGLSFSPDGQHVVVAGEKGIAGIFDVVTRKLVHSLQAGGGRELSASVFGDGGRAILTTSFGNASIELWNAQDGTIATKFKGYASANGADLSKNGALAVTADMSGPPRLWDVRAGAFLTSLSGENAWSVVFAPQATQIATTSGSGPIYIFDCAPCGPLADVMRLARERLKGALTAEQERAVANQ